MADGPPGSPCFGLDFGGKVAHCVRNRAHFDEIGREVCSGREAELNKRLRPFHAANADQPDFLAWQSKNNVKMG